MTDRQKVSITFDDDNHIRVLEADKFKEVQSMGSECSAFIDKIGIFNDTVRTLVTILDTQAQKIETEKLRAIGQRNRVDGEAENRKKKQQELQALINEKKAELERFSLHHESLMKVEAEQKALIEKLTNNEA
eukprot:GILK01005643.1.p1 GENE.GILK01005643.1~~GILK01005643.1.p1  ORF type:complete len:150 (+),score=37.11 GILK01005643.1:55-450(+)